MLILDDVVLVVESVGRKDAENGDSLRQRIRPERSDEDFPRPAGNAP